MPGADDGDLKPRGGLSQPIHEYFLITLGAPVTPYPPVPITIPPDTNAPSPSRALGISSCGIRKIDSKMASQGNGAGTIQSPPRFTYNGKPFHHTARRMDIQESPAYDVEQMGFQDQIKAHRIVSLRSRL